MAGLASIIMSIVQGVIRQVMISECNEADYRKSACLLSATYSPSIVFELILLNIVVVPNLLKSALFPW